MDPHAFFRKAEREFYDDPNSAQCFEPRPCDFLIFKHMKNTEVIVEHGTLSGDDVVTFVDAELDPEAIQVVRIIFTPARSATDPFTSIATYTSIPFKKKIFKHVSDRLHFHTSCFEPKFHEGIRRIVCGEVTSFILSCGGNPHENNTRTFVSINNKTHITTVFVHGTLPHELEHIRERLAETWMLPFAIHPLTLLVILVKYMVDGEDTKLARMDSTVVTRLPTMSQDIDELQLESESRQAIFVEHTLAAFTERWEYLERTLELLLMWAKETRKGSLPEIHQIYLKEADIIICHHLNDLQETVKGAQSCLRKVQAFNGVHRHMLEVRIAETGNKVNLQIAAQSRDIALDSRRDASAMKAIAVLTMLFLPGTFVSTCFAMPLFDWNAPTASSVVNSRFWIYIVITVPTTFVVLMSWRLWYRFGEWKQWQDRSEEGTSSARTFMKEFLQWLRAGRPTNMQKVEGEIEED